MILVRCPGCHTAMRARDDLVGRQVRCPGCHQPVTVPPPGPAPSRARTLPSAPGPGRRHAGEPGRERWDFLAPPEGPGELGRLGPYRILKVLGAGGMGVVFQAEDPRLRRLLAVKAMLPALAASDTARRRFLREGQAAAAIENDHIVPIYQVGEDRGVPFLAMPFLKGESLDRRAERERVLPVAEVLRIGRETAAGLAAAHAAGLVHRDIKPANLWLEAPAGRVKILDFGLARAAASTGQLTQQGAVVGTPAYMAPEQATGEALDGRCDLFSLGCVLYQLCTGELPFQGADLVATLVAVATVHPPAPAELRPELPPALSDLILHLLAKKPADRPRSAQEVAAALAALAADTTLRTAAVRRAPKPPPPETVEVRPAPAGRRWLVPAAVAAAAAGALVAGLLTAALAFTWTAPRGGTAQAPGPVRPPTSAEDPWLRQVAALPAAKQVQAVADRLRERNPGFDGKVTPVVKDGVVTELHFSSDHVRDLAPVRALSGLQGLTCSGGGRWEGYALVGNGQVADLEPLRGLRLTSLDCSTTQVTDLAPLQGMPLTSLRCSGTKVADLRPLRGMPLTQLEVFSTWVSDLEPLRDMKLTRFAFGRCRKVSSLEPLRGMPLIALDCSWTEVSDLGPLQGMPLIRLNATNAPVSSLGPLRGMQLTTLDVSWTRVSDLGPLRGMPLTSLNCSFAPVADLAPLRETSLTDLDCYKVKTTDLAPLKGLPLRTLVWNVRPERDAPILRSLKTLEQINRKPVDQFWKEQGGAPRP